MMRDIRLFDAFIGLVVAFVVIVWTRRLVAFVKAGEIHALMNASGEGLSGDVARSESPLLFWLVVTLHGLFLAALTAACLMWVFTG